MFGVVVRKKQFGLFFLIFGLLVFCFFSLLFVFLCPSDQALSRMGRVSIEEMLCFSFISALLMLTLQLRLGGGLAVMFGVAVVAGIHELVQVWTPFREAAWPDWSANIFAALMGVILGGSLGVIAKSLLRRS